jgi:hypothetical protein
MTSNSDLMSNSKS